jgi:hypothetical protein
LSIYSLILCRMGLRSFQSRFFSWRYFRELPDP